MDYLQAKAELDAMTGPLDLTRPPPLSQVADWVERLVADIPASDLHDVGFQVNTFEDDRNVISGFMLYFPESWVSEWNHYHVTLMLRRSSVPDDEPLLEPTCYLKLKDFPTAAEFFAAVRAEAGYRAADGYPFDEVSSYLYPELPLGWYKPFPIRPADLDHLHDSPVLRLSCGVEPPKELSMVVQVRNEAGGPFERFRGKAVRVTFRDVLFAQTNMVGGRVNGEEFDRTCDERTADEIERLRRFTETGHATPPVRMGFCLTGGSEVVVACESIELREWVKGHADETP